MPRAALAADEAVRVGIHRHALSGLHAGTIGIGNARVRAPGILDSNAQFDRDSCIDIPRVPQVQIRKYGGHACRIGESSGRVGLRVAGDGAGLIKRGLDRIGVEIGRTGRTLALAKVHSQPEATVTRMLDRLHLTEPHIHAQPGFDAGGNLSLTGAGGACATNHVFGQSGQTIHVTLAVIELTMVQADGDFTHVGLSLNADR